MNFTEKALQRNYEGLNETELIQLIIGSDKETAQKILESSHSVLQFLASASHQKLQDIIQLDPNRTTVLKAAIELGKRMASQENELLREIIQDFGSAYRLFQLAMIAMGQNKENCYAVVPVNNDFEPLALEIVQGEIDPDQLQAEKVLAPVLDLGVNKFHLIQFRYPPQGNEEPQPADEQLLRRLRESGLEHGLLLMDYIICSRETVRNCYQRVGSTEETTNLAGQYPEFF